MYVAFVCFACGNAAVLLLFLTEKMPYVGLSFGFCQKKWVVAAVRALVTHTFLLKEAFAKHFSFLCLVFFLNMLNMKLHH